MPKGTEGSGVDARGPYIQFALGEGAEPIRFRETEMLRLALMDRVRQAMIPVKRGMYQHDGKGRVCGVQDVDVESEWPAAGMISPEGVHCGYSVQTCFDCLEDVLLRDGASVLRRVLSAAVGFEIPSVEGVEVTLIQCGLQHGIFKITPSFPDERSFVATVSRDPFFNDDMVDDYLAMQQLVQLESRRLGLTGRDSNIPRRYGIFTEGGLRPSFYLADFVEGAEVNIDFGHGAQVGERRVHLNGINQAERIKVLDNLQSDSVMAEIAAVLFKYAGLSGIAFYAAMQGGDFMCDEKNAKIYWHVFRNPHFMDRYLMVGGEKSFASSSMTSSRANGIGWQLAQLLTQTERPVTEVGGVLAGRDVAPSIGYTYEIRDLVSGLKIALSAGWISEEQIALAITSLGPVKDVVEGTKKVRYDELMRRLKGNIDF